MWKFKEDSDVLGPILPTFEKVHKCVEDIQSAIDWGTWQTGF